MRENVFAREMAQSFKYLFPDNLYIKIPDSYGMQRFTTVKYIDAIFFRTGKFYALEYKQVRDAGPFQKDKLNPIQRKTLEQVQNDGGAAYIIINYRFGKGKQRIDVALVLKYDEFKQLETKVNRKSIPFNTLKENSVNMKYKYIKESGKSLKVWKLEEIIAF